jgi:hypothetical protein
MRSFLAFPANSYFPDRIHPALTSLADECCGMLARLFAYVGTLALLAILGVHLWDQLPELADAGPAAPAEWSTASRSQPAFAMGKTDSSRQRLMRPSGIRKAAGRTSFDGVPPADGRSPNSKSIGRGPK